MRIKDSVYGIGRGIIATTLTLPLEVIKTRQQIAKKPQNCVTIAKEIYHRGGMRDFYRGFSPQLTKITLRQIWVWPIISSDLGLPPYISEGSKGILIASIETAVATPFERIKILLMTHKRKTFSLKSAWKGSFEHGLKLTANWTLFLISQRFLRERALKKQSELSLRDLLYISFQTTILVSTLSAPFDIANTIKQVHNIGIFQLLKISKKQLFVGMPISFAARLIQCGTSVPLIHYLSQKKV